MKYRRLLVIGAVFAVWAMMPHGAAYSTINQYSGGPPPPGSPPPPPSQCFEVFDCKGDTAGAI